MGEGMTKQNIKDKSGKIIGEYNPKALRYRYNVEGNNKSSVTTKINKRSSADFSNWYKRNRIDSIKEIMLFDKQPLDKINSFIKRVEQRAEEKDSYGKNLGSELHDWIDLYFKNKKQPTLPESEPLRTMAQKWLRFWKSQKFKVVASELPMYSPKFDCCGTNDVIVTKDSWKGQYAVLDWKTSKDYAFEHVIQIEMYKKFIEETTKFKISKLAVVNIPKEPEKEVSMFIVKANEYFKSFQAICYLDKMESKFKDDLKKWKKENKKNV
jgi:hypothetical protein